jgi:hypothetical protein
LRGAQFDFDAEGVAAALSTGLLLIAGLSCGILASEGVEPSQMGSQGAL